MTIVQISASDSNVYGLGDDQKIYYWVPELHEWKPWPNSGE